MTLKPVDEQIIIIRLGADHEFKSRFPSILLPDTMYEDPSGLGVVHDFDDCEPMTPGLKPLREIIRKGDLVRFTRHATGRRFMDVTGDREIVLPNEYGIPTTYSFIRREHLLAKIENWCGLHKSVEINYVGEIYHRDTDSAAANAAAWEPTIDTIEANKALNLCKFGLLDPDDFYAVFQETGEYEVYVEPGDNAQQKHQRPCFRNLHPMSSTTKRIREMLSDKLKVKPEGRTNIFLVEHDEIIRYIATRDTTQFHCYEDVQRGPLLGCYYQLSETADTIHNADRIAITTGDIYLQNMSHALSVIVDETLYLFDIGMFNGDNLEIISDNQQ